MPNFGCVRGTKNSFLRLSSWKFSSAAPNLKKAKEAAENAKGKMTYAAKRMFQFYTNLLSVEAKYAWNKIVTEQTQSNPYVDLQGICQKGPRGALRQSFEDCMLFYLLTVFLINAAEQEKYFITNVLKKPQHVSMCQLG